MKKPIWPLIIPIILVAIIPIVFRPNLFYLGLYIFLVIISAGMIIRNYYKQQTPPIVYSVYMKAIEHRMSFTETTGIIGLSTTLWGFLFTLIAIAFSTRNLFNNSTIAILAFAFIIYLLFDQSLNLKIWDYCVSAAADIKKIDIVGIILPVILVIILIIINTFILHDIMSESLPMLILAAVFTRQIFLVAHVMKLDFSSVESKNMVF